MTETESPIRRRRGAQPRSSGEPRARRASSGMPPGASTGALPSDYENFVYQPFVESNPLTIPRELLDELAGDYGMVFQWTAFEVFGAEQRRNVTAKLQNHWSPVRCGDFDGRLAAWADCDNPTKSTVIEQGGLRLMCRPRCIQEMALQ